MPPHSVAQYLLYPAPQPPRPTRCTRMCACAGARTRSLCGTRPEQSRPLKTSSPDPAALGPSPDSLQTKMPLHAARRSPFPVPQQPSVTACLFRSNSLQTSNMGSFPRSTPSLHPRTSFRTSPPPPPIHDPSTAWIASRSSGILPSATPTAATPPAAAAATAAAATAAPAPAAPVTATPPSDASTGGAESLHVPFLLVRPAHASTSGRRRQSPRASPGARVHNVCAQIRACTH